VLLVDHERRTLERLAVHVQQDPGDGRGDLLVDGRVGSCATPGEQERHQHDRGQTAGHGQVLRQGVGFGDGARGAGGLRIRRWANGPAPRWQRPDRDRWSGSPDQSMPETGPEVTKIPEKSADPALPTRLRSSPDGRYFFARRDLTTDRSADYSLPNLLS